MADSPPPISDLKIAPKKSSKKLSLLWTNPELSGVLDARDQSTQRVIVTDYDIRFLHGAAEITEDKFSSATPVRFHSCSDSKESGAKPLASSGSPKNSANLEHDHFKMGEVCLHLLFGTGRVDAGYQGSRLPPHDERPQFRDRRRGAYAMKYRDLYYGWSPVSNSVFDPGDVRIHKLTMQVAASAGVSAGPVGAGAVSIYIRDPDSFETVRYDVATIGGAVGAKASLTGSPGIAEFEPHEHMHAGDFDGMGINMLTQGGALLFGYTRGEAHIFDEPKYAVAMDRARNSYSRSHLVAGPIDLSGFQMGLEANFLSILVGRLNKF